MSKEAVLRRGESSANAILDLLKGQAKVGQVPLDHGG
jgi:hypothetical protein